MLTTLPPFCAFVTKSGNLNFLEPSGHLRACNGTDLPLLCPSSGARDYDVDYHIGRFFLGLLWVGG